MRVIAGKYKSLKLNTFEHDNIRPTTDMVKENVFNKIQFIIKNSKFLDLFGGTGAIGIEAVSRGAEVFVADNNKNSCELIKSNYKKINVEPKLLYKDYIEALNYYRNNNIKFDICYIDPPYKSDCGVNAINKIIELDLLAEGGLIVFEHLKEDKFHFIKGLSVVDSKNYGTITVDFIKKEAHCVWYC